MRNFKDASDGFSCLSVFSRVRRLRSFNVQDHHLASAVSTSIGSAGVRDAQAVPWELLRDRHTDTVLALRAAAFVRTHDEPLEPPQPVRAEAGPIRILLVICRP
jgi:hypothetical protein